jgi:hypothetical protein
MVTDQNLKRRNPDEEKEDSQNVIQEELQISEEARIPELYNENNTIGNDPEPEIEEDIDPDVSDSELINF